jgi:hypothetical protein
MTIENKPKILRGAFVEFGHRSGPTSVGGGGSVNLPPLVVVFQFNPMQLTRNRELSFDFPHPAPVRRGRDTSATLGDTQRKTLRQYHHGFSDLAELQKQQLVTVAEQTIGFEMRLDATAGLDRNDRITTQFGIAPQLATLELMAYPKGESVLTGAQDDTPGTKKGHSFTRGSNPPLVLFIFGRKRVLPVNINSLHITETDFSTDLNPIRATAAITLTVIEGKNAPYSNTLAMTEMMSLLNLANIADVADIVIPG